MIIAEIGWNFLGDLSLAKEMIDQASDAGCKFIKFQLWDPKDLKEGPWDDDGRREIYNKSFLNEEKYSELFHYSYSKKLDCFASIFNHSSIDTLLKFSNKFIKIPSLEAYDLELIKKSLDLFENVLVSTGALKFEELKNLEKFKNCENLIIFHCVSSYPLKLEDSNFSKFFYLKERFKKVGYSGHCEGIDDALFALSHGAVAIEKHFTKDNTLPGRDNKFAILKDKLKFLCNYQKSILKMKNNKGLDLQESEIEAFNYYRGRWKKN
jgi:sialic acid synthase SpsE